ncbi:NUDIX hydrolase [Streptomyces sp. JJ36]|uniref:NUDIX hydrolase n=1 Tax=Streptomyces sp. JJ36 TaxID=2736645 RepID=UPI001F17F3BB|nr:NUDIX domain-containing protein [Streptomyces sp. JJ36]MCF6523726.1 NUDIX domain-containing protein [Streptomyces sp. JJ36]
MAHTPEPRPLASGPLGMRLLSFHRAGETGENGEAGATGGTCGVAEEAEFPDAPVRYALLLLRHGDRVLMVHVRSRDCWELPGGGIEPGERPRETAAREVWEEAGQRVPPEALRFAGFARTALGPRQRVWYGAVFTARTEAPQPFTPNAEVSAAHWRRGLEPLPGGGEVQTVDEYLIAHCPG